MADEQGLDIPDGFFARAKTGSKVKALLARVGSSGRGFEQLSSPPSNPSVGDVYLSDGTGWDPNAAGSPELVAYNASGGWTSIAILS